MDEHTRRIIARLYAIHLASHPKRIAAWTGCTPRQLRALWREYVERGHEFELSSALEDLELLQRRRARQRAQKPAAPISDNRPPAVA
jgi:hypothetical protein